MFPLDTVNDVDELIPGIVRETKMDIATRLPDGAAWRSGQVPSLRKWTRLV